MYKANSPSSSKSSTANADARVVNGDSNDENETSLAEQDIDSDEETAAGSDDVEADD